MSFKTKSTQPQPPQTQPYNPHSVQAKPKTETKGYSSQPAKVAQYIPHAPKSVSRSSHSTRQVTPVYSSHTAREVTPVPRPHISDMFHQGPSFSQTADKTQSISVPPPGLFPPGAYPSSDHPTSSYAAPFKINQSIPAPFNYDVTVVRAPDQQKHPEPYKATPSNGSIKTHKAASQHLHGATPVPYNASMPIPRGEDKRVMLTQHEAERLLHEKNLMEERYNELSTELEELKNAIMPAIVQLGVNPQQLSGIEQINEIFTGFIDEFIQLKSTQGPSVERLKTLENEVQAGKELGVLKERMINKLEDEVKKLKDNLIALEASRETLNKKLESLETLIQKFEKENREKDIEIQHLKKTAQDLKESNQELKGSESTINELKKINSDLEENLLQLSDELEQKNVENKLLLEADTQKRMQLETVYGSLEGFYQIIRAFPHYADTTFLNEKNQPITTGDLLIGEFIDAYGDEIYPEQKSEEEKAGE